MQAKTIFVSGASGGIGAAVTSRLLAEGHRVVAADVSPPEGAQDCVEERFLSLSFDVRDHERCKGAIERAAEAFGGIDALVNVAGVCFGGGPDTAAVEDWETTFDVNVKGVFQLTQCALAKMAGNARSDIINISSIWGVDYTHALLSYSASKFAVEGFTGGLRLWGMPRNVRVCAIQVDKVDTGFRRNLGTAGEFPPDKLERMLQPCDVADVVAFVLSTSRTAQVSSLRLDAPLWVQA